MARVKATTRTAVKHINKLEEFRVPRKPNGESNSDSSIFATIYEPNEDVHTTRYVVYSYGTHFPMYICEISADGSRQWYRNMDKYSPTTSKHMTQCHPDADCLPMDTASMKRIDRYGIKGVALDLPVY